MSFLAKLNIDGEEMNVLDCSFGFHQLTDATGRPSEKPKGGQLRLIIESTAKTDFLEWMISSTNVKKGEVTFYRRDSMSTLKKIVFEDAYCVDYTEQFNATSNQPLQIRLVLSAREISIKGTTFTNNWPVKG
ncbi:type VI secretion system tube protein TssD [Spongiivirga citrea]|uniref:Type VI secretion system needle protein Hcp n=1 Tax=Spongiivirga citrea TaxID=1481457 RepID=A0A6M0CRQ0_9FLAO|nr:type VI secretion system tube protein TssD [Spongiivirga citrea]NER18529.1 hypothetical protein [Spongiivirga citrea]